MVYMPQTVSDEITAFCKECKNNDQVVDKLEQNLPLYIKFFEAASNDAKWQQNCPQIMERINTFLDMRSGDGGLSLEEARTINQVAKNRFGDASPLGKNNITITVPDPDPKKPPVVFSMNRMMLAAASPFFKAFFKPGSPLMKKGEENQFEFRLINAEIFKYFKDYIETGNFSSVAKADRATLEELARTCDFVEMPDLANIARLALAAKIDSPQLRNTCLAYIAQQFPGLTLFSNSSNDSGIIITNFQQGAMTKLAPLLAFYRTIYNQPGFSLTLPIGLSFCLSDREEENMMHEITRHMPWLTEFYGSRSSSTTDNLMAILAANCPHLKGMFLHHCTNITDETLQALSTHCQELEQINLGECNIGKPGFQALIRGCPNIKSMDISWNSLLNDDDLIAAAQHCTHLNSLYLKITPGITQRGILAIANTHRLQAIEIVPEEENGYQPEENRQMSNTILTRLAQASPNLTDFYYARNIAAEISDEGVQALTLHCPHLKEVTLGYENILHDFTPNPACTDNAIGFFADCMELEHLNVATSFPIRDEIVLKLAACTKLRTLQLNLGVNIPYKTLWELSLSCPDLVFVNNIHIQNIRDEAQRQGFDRPEDKL